VDFIQLTGLHLAKPLHLGGYGIVLSTPQIPHPVISISLDPLSRTWLASNLQQTLTWSKLSPPG